jgi:hypothetical protein
VGAVIAVAVCLGLARLAGILAAAIVGVVVLVLALGEASYQEWNRWASHKPPDLTIKPHFWPTGGLTLYITNDDVDGIFRALVTDITAAASPLQRPPDDAFPWTLVWGDQQTADYRLIRGETAHIPVVGADPSTRKWLFAGPKGPHDMWAVLENGEPQTNIVVHFRIIRLEPASGIKEISVPVSFPGWASAVVARGDGAALSPAIGIDEAIEAQITRGSAVPGTNEVNWTTEGKRNRHIHLDFEPRVLRFFSPVDETVTTVPSKWIPVGSGRVMVTRFFQGGFMVDEVGTVGDVVRVEPYRANVLEEPSRG